MVFSKETGVRRNQACDQICFPGLVTFCSHTHSHHSRQGQKGKLYLNKSLSGEWETPLKPKVTFVLYLAAVLLGRSKNCARGGDEGETRGKRGGPSMTEFTSDSKLASCISSWGKKRVQSK